MIMSTLFVFCGWIISLSLSLNYDSLCLTGAVTKSHDGTYKYWKTVYNPNGLVWYNSHNGLFLFPWDYGTVVEWRVGPTYTNSSAYIACNPASKS